MKSILVLVLLQLGLLASALAQHSVDVDSGSVVSTVRIADSADTVQAIHQIFADKRGDARYTTDVGLLTIGVGGVVLAPTLTVVYAIGSLFRSSPDPGRVATFSLTLLSPGLSIITFGLIKRSRFSKRREEAVVQTYLEGQPLPPVIRRKLRKKQFGTKRR